MAEAGEDGGADIAEQRHSLPRSSSEGGDYAKRHDDPDDRFVGILPRLRDSRRARPFAFM